MKKTFTFMLLALFCICGYAQTIDPVLLQEMGRRTDDEKIQVVVIMKSQCDRQQLGRHASNYATRAERRDYVVSEMKQFAESSQYDLRRALNEMERHGMTTTPTNLWMANALYFSATKQAINDLAMRSDVQLIGYDELRYAMFEEESRPANLTREISAHVTNVNADDVWALGYTGQNVVVALLDSGVNYNHVDLADHLWDGGSDYPHHGYDFINNDNDPMDDNGKGTHCAGTICGDGTAGKQTGIAPSATLMCVKVLNANGEGTVSKACEAMQWAVEQGCDVLSIPFGWSNSSIAERILLRTTCAAVLDAGVIGAVAAGDRGGSTSSYPIPNNVTVPGSCPPPYMDPVQASNAGGLSCALTVGAVYVDNYTYNSSSKGPVTWLDTEFEDYPYTDGSSTEFGLIRPDLCAPGVSIQSTDYNNTSGYTTMSGTSTATACVTGCISLLLSKNYNATPAEICQLLEENAHQFGSYTGKNNTTGYGRVDALAAINAMSAGPLSLEEVVVNDISGNNDHKLNPGESVTLHLTLKNNAQSALDGVTMVLSAESEYVNITNGTTTLPSMASGQIIINQNLFGFTLSADAPPTESIWFAAEAFRNGESLGILRFNLMVWGHALTFQQVTVTNDNNGNGSLEPGETGVLHVVISNEGNEAAPYINGTLSSTFDQIFIVSSGQSFGTIPVGGQASADFNVALMSTAPNSYTIDFSLDLLDGYNNHTIVDFELWRRAITLTSDPVGAGTLTGGGNYGAGQSCTINATANNNYAFTNWTKDGEIVSYLSSYTFNVTEGAEYVAHFQQIDGKAPGNPTSESAYLPSYTYFNYSMSQQIYTAAEMGGVAHEISSLSFFNTGTYTRTRNLTIYMVHTQKSAFNSQTDWIPVTSDNIVFSGNVSITSGNWTTIYFATPFSFNGTSNVALIVDDNTGSYGYLLKFRTFSTTGNQAIYINGSTNYDPYNTSGYTGTRISQKNHVIFGYANYNYTITTTVNPTNGGTVSITGNTNSHYYGRPITVTATPASGYVFCNWTKDNSVVSNYPSYSFTVTESVQLVANFQPMEGVSIGVPTSASSILPVYYSNFLTQQIYTAAEMGNQSCQISSVSFYNNNSYNTTRNDISVFLVQTSKSSFANQTDWITVTEADRVFNGNITFSKGWTTVYFDRIIEYNGTSNLALIFANNSAGNSSPSCRTFPTTNNQVLYMYGGSTPYDPFNPSSYTGTLAMAKNQVVFGFPTGNYTVTVTANNPAYGTVSGGGSNFYQGQYCTVTATPNANYCFNNWTVDGTVVSSDATYTFPVTGNINLVGNFMEPIMITTGVNPEQSGTVTGAGGYANGQACTLTATPNPGYVFTYWGKTSGSGYSVVSCLSPYTFNVTTNSAGQYVAYFKQLNENDIAIGEPTKTNNSLPEYLNSNYSLTQQIYTANELGGPRQIASVSFFNTTSFYTQPNRDIVVYLVHTNKTAFESTTDWISVTDANIVYSGTYKPTSRNWSTIYFNQPFTYNGTSNLALVIYDKSNVRNSNILSRTFNTESSQAICVNSNNLINPSNPTNTGTLLTEKNQIILGVPVYGYSMTLTANPANAGTVSGGQGNYFYGQPVTITATPNPGYVFNKWTRTNNNNAVSYLSPAAVAIGDNNDYVAQFQPMEGIAIGNPSRTNMNLPTNVDSYYSLSQQIYTAEELNTDACSFSSMSFFNTGYSTDRTISIYMVNTEKTAFSSMTDWISVTDADMVYSGTVNVKNANWTTIYFTSPFNYDGTSNVALVVYDHTAYYSSNLNCRTFSTSTTQAIYATDSYPINTSNPVVVSTLLSEKNHIVFGVASFDFTVTVTADPAEGGTVSGGGGPYYYGMPITISATANPGYVFDRWSKHYETNGNTYYYDNYSYYSTNDISVEETAEYIAHFQQMDGIVIGEAVKTSSYLPDYSYYSLTQQIYTAAELGNVGNDISSVSFYNTYTYSVTRNFDVYLVHTTKSSFDSSTDWIPVTADDLVFSGSITMTSGWTTIFFNTTFAYDGSSNLALIINNKTGQSSSSFVCRTFDTGNTQQAIYVSRGYNSPGSYDPTNPSEYTGTRLTQKNQVVFGIANYIYPVTALANPTEGGTANIIGNGQNNHYYYGQPITIKAISNPGYAFSTWTKGDELVSCFSENNASVTDSTEYVANFQQFDGIIIGEPSPHANSYLPTNYYNAMTEEIFTASEMKGQRCQISSISFFNTGTYSRTRSKIDIYMVHTQKTKFDSITDWIPVTANDTILFSGSVTFPSKNWVTIYFTKPFYYDGTSNVALVVRDYSNSYNPSYISCRTFDTQSNQVLRITGSSNTTFDPHSPSGNGTLLSIKNQVVFGYARYNYDIFAGANPMNGGFVSGDVGQHYYNQPVTLTATPASGYVFTNWTKGDVVVSHYPTYSFAVTESATFVANFKKVEGIAIGAPVTSSTYLPTNYYNSLTQQIYTTAEMGSMSRDISSISFYNLGTYNGSNNNLDIYMVYTNKTAFDSINDWITVTEADKVFSGKINVIANNWTTINFNKLFHYNGSSNVVLVVDNNSGYSYTNINGRTFNTDENYQAIRVSSYATNYDPTNPSGYSGTRMTMKNQVIFGIPSCIYTVNVTADPEASGTVSGGGEGFFLGQHCTVTATANEGYCFYNWSGNGTETSSDTTYTFAVTGDMNIVGHFGEPYMITTVSNPEEGGTTSGGGAYRPNQSCTVHATASPGYVFTKWTYNQTSSSYSNYYYSTRTFTVTKSDENKAHFQQVNNGVAIGDAVANSYYLPTNSYYSLTQQIYTANEMGGAAQISSVSFFNTSYKTRNLTVYLVHTDKTAFADGTDWIPVTEDDIVFSGNVTMSSNTWAPIYFSTPFNYNGTSNIALIIDDNTNSSTSAYCRTFNAEGNQAIRISSSDTNYDPYNTASYTGTLMTEKNQVIFGYVSSDYTVNVNSNNTAYGTVSGGEGTYYLGQPCTVTATPNPGYIFYYWKYTNGYSIVSYDATYTFQVMNNMNLVAYFGPAIHITTTASPAEGGVVTGAGDYAVGHSFTLTATANPGYVFVEWRRSGYYYPESYLSTDNFSVPNYDSEFTAVFELAYPDIVIGDAETKNYDLPYTYYYSISEQIYTAEEIGTSGIIHDLSFFSTYYDERNLTIYLKHTDKSEFGNNYDWIPVSESDKVFSGTVTMTGGEWTEIVLDSLFVYDGSSNIVLVVDDNTGNYGDSDCRAFSTENYQAICANSYNTNFDPYNLTDYWGNLYNTKNQIKLGFAHTITATADPTEGGTVTGGGVCPKGDTCTVSARPAQNYHFFYWTENEETVSIDTTYSFTVESDRNLVAHFEQVTNHWNVNSGYPGTMIVLAVIEINDVEQRSDLLEVGAFCGTECRGTALASYISSIDRFAVLLTLNGATGDELTFKLYDHRIGQELDLTPPTMDFVNGLFILDTSDPYVLAFYNVQIIVLEEGWNSISLYIKADDDPVAMLDLLKDGLGEYGLTIINEEGYTEYDGEWFGDLDEIGVTNYTSYDILVSEEVTEDITIEIRGTPTDPADYVITITPGWNYIGFPCTEEVEIAVALATFEVEEGDMIVSIEGSTAFENEEWFGDFDTFVPGQGYLYLSQSNQTKTFTFSTGAKARRVKPKK